MCRTCDSAAKATQRLQARRAARVLVNEYLSAHPCADCGETDLGVLEFDHDERSDKQQNVGTLITQGYPWATIEREIGKCTVRCANCHRRRTAKQMGWYATD